MNVANNLKITVKMESYLKLLRETLWHIGIVSQLGAGVVQGFRSLRSFVQSSARESCTVCKDQELADPGTARASSVSWKAIIYRTHTSRIL